ncbi:MAG: Rrf2 family transcriptional regulator [Parvibaculaceae bacterium]|jgi:Rrf2 family nitric oxide-sensitive transcriptional repressor|nr:Rrf2 family transcriptional regulator [Parvibaculaceae bacterium]
MHVTRHTDYALRMLMLLAVEPDDLHTIEEISMRYNISKNHLMKVAQTLAHNDFIETFRGRSGGLRLRHSPQSINLGQVVRATEDGFDLVECFDKEKNTCSISGVCGLRGPLEEALAAFLAVLDKYSLDDLVTGSARARKMRRILDVDFGVTG